MSIQTQQLPRFDMGNGSFGRGTGKITIQLNLPATEEADIMDRPYSPQGGGHMKARTPHGRTEDIFEALAALLKMLMKKLSANGEGGGFNEHRQGRENIPRNPLAPVSRNAAAPGVPNNPPPYSPPAAAAPGAPPAPPGAPPATPSEASAPPAKVQPAGVPTGPGNTITYTNDGTKPMHIKFTPNAGEQEIPDLELQPGETKTLSFPQGWSGNWRSTAGNGDAYTLGEVKFQGGGNTTFYDDSRIEGSNMGETIEPAGGGRKTGSLTNLLENAPDDVLARNAQGQVYGIKKSTVRDVQDPAVVNYLHQKIAVGDAYAYPTDDAATAGAQDTHLVVHMKDFV